MTANSGVRKIDRRIMQGYGCEHLAIARIGKVHMRKLVAYIAIDNGGPVMPDGSQTYLAAERSRFGMLAQCVIQPSLESSTDPDGRLIGMGSHCQLNRAGAPGVRLKRKPIRLQRFGKHNNQPRRFIGEL